MIAGLREPSAGTIIWNDRSYAEWDTNGLRSRIAVAMQDHHKWPFSVATNIAMGDIDGVAEPARIEAAAVKAAAHEMIEELPHGYDTLLDRTFTDCSRHHVSVTIESGSSPARAAPRKPRRPAPTS